MVGINILKKNIVCILRPLRFATCGLFTAHRVFVWAAHLTVDATLSNVSVFFLLHMKLHGLAGPHYCWNFIEVLILYFFLLVLCRNYPAPYEMFPKMFQNITVNLNHFYFFPLQIWVGAAAGYGPPQQLFMCLNSQALKLYFTYISFPVYL